MVGSLQKENAMPHWQPVTSETVYAIGRLYAVLMPGYDPFLAYGKPHRSDSKTGLFDFDDHGEWSRYARFYWDLGPMDAPEIEACKQEWRDKRDKPKDGTIYVP
jgi:hypothetical protein